MEKRKYPIGVQDFADIIESGCVYIDKTEYIYELSHSGGKPFFLSRPRRFGKSLLLSTMRYYFEGRRELFTNLKIAKLEKEWINYPVFNISFANSDFSSNNNLVNYIEGILRRLEKFYEVKDIFPGISDRFQNLIIKAHEVTGKKVVVLIDEYDKPILDALYSDEEHKNRTLLRDFYSPLKGMDEYLKFIFITGITKISHVNIFSGLNQLNDISMNKSYSSICGISQTELEKYFKADIESLAERQEINVEETKKVLAERYDGYHFTHDVEGVYNPFCLMKCFSEEDFGSYWFETGTPSYLAKTLQHEPLFLAKIIGDIKAEENDFKNYDPETNNLLPVIYQSGYLTIKDFEKQTRIYTLDFPNKEVEDGFLKVLIKKFVKFPEDNMGISIQNLVQYLKGHDVDNVMKIIKAAIADLPTVLKKDACENYYESITHLMFRVTGLDVISELQSFSGRSDVIVRTEDAVYIFELKMDNGRTLEDVMKEALSQIDEKGYADRFAVSGKKLFKIGVVFSSSGKGLLGWKLNKAL